MFEFNKTEREEYMRRSWFSKGRFGIVGLLMGLALVLSACGSSGDSDSGDETASGGSSQETQDVKFMLEWAPNASQVWAIAGKEQGYFEKNGIDPEFLFPDDSTSPTKVLLAGKADFALQLSTAPAIARGEGEDVKVVGTVEALDVGIMVPKDEISTVQELNGATLGVGASTYNETCAVRLLEKHGLSEDDVKFVDPAFNLVAPMLAGKVQGVNGSQYEQAIALSKEGLETKVFSYSDNGCPIDPIQVVATTEMVEDNPELVKSLLKGIGESLQYAMDNPEEATEIFGDAYPELDPKSDLAQWQASVPTFCTAQSEAKGLLYSDPKEYEGLIELSQEAGAIDEVYPVDELVDNSLLPDPPITQPCANDRYKVDPMSQITE